MRIKTNYTEYPVKFEIIDGINGKKKVCLRTNILSKETDDGIIYEADEYTIDVSPSDNLAERLTDNFDAWLKMLMDEEYEIEAAKVRAKRDELLKESDERMSLDRIGLQVPSTPDFTDWLHFLRAIGDAISGEWARYRQALRDIPQQTGFPFNVRFPEKPNEKGDRR